ncbi:MAG: hypothetical protein C0483_25420 [Pirellula sp.]|nr:hypothetical protein [Pirellula sp.]
MARVGPGLTSLVAFVAACGAAAACSTSTGAAEPAKPQGGWYSSGTRPAAESTRNNDDVSRPVRGEERVPTPIVPYASTLFGSSRTDLPNVPAPLPAQAAPGEQLPWNAATPPVVDLGRDFGVAPPQATQRSSIQPPSTKTLPSEIPAPGRSAEVRPPVTQDASQSSVVPMGPLVPVTLPSLIPQPKVEPAPSLKPLEQPRASEAMTPVKSPRGSSAKNGATKAAPATKGVEQSKSTPQARLEAPGVLTPKSAAPKNVKPASPARFSLPQPAIPLESRRPHLLRKALGS